MAGFLYFRSGDTRAPALDAIKRLGLGYAIAGNVTSRETTANSPSGSPGCVFGEESRHANRTIGYYPGDQTWRKLPNVADRPELWIGYWTDGKPTPADLARPAMLPGEVAMKLGDDMWTIPTLCEFDQETQRGECELPAPLDYDDAGNLFVGKPTGVYGELWDAVHPVALGLCFAGAEGEIREPSEAEVRAAAFALLAANYVVSMPELVMLGALQQGETFRNIVMASCRGRWLIEAIEDVTKKNETPPAESGSDSSAGEAA